MKGQMTHPDADVLAEFRAGLITGRRGNSIAAHLAGCDRCAALDDKLTRVSALLAAARAPAMPDSVARRLDTVLAAEVANRDYSERAGGDGSPEPGARKRPAGNPGFRLVALRVLAPAAAVLLAAGGYGLSRLVSGPPGQALPGTAAGIAASASTASSGRAVAPAEGTASATGQPRANPNIRSPFSFTFVTSGTNYLPGSLRHQLEAVMPASASVPTQAPPQQMLNCVRNVTGGVKPVFVDEARFEGQPATVIVVPAGQGKGYQASVAGAGCSASRRDLLATTTLPPTTKLPQGISAP